MDMFASSLVPKEVGKTVIFLIPKINQPGCCSQFRPISLCNVTYKTLTKILVERN